MEKLSELNIGSAADRFAELIKKGRLPHAILLDGGNSESRDRTSSFLAASFVCENEDRPCGLCINCMKAQEKIHPDVIITDPEALNEKIFKVDLVREIRTDAFILPNEAAKKVYILKSADKMNVQAQNALLKILEEPPEYVRFILECESRAAMLDTIISRVSSFNLGAGENLLNTELLQKADTLAGKLAQALLNPSEVEFMRLTAEFEKDKELLSAVLPPLQLVFRDAAVISAGSSVTVGNHTDVSRMLASKLSLKSLTALVKSCDHFSDCINKNANKNLLITRFCSVMRSSAYNG